jgi:hypothetical protein
MWVCHYLKSPSCSQKIDLSPLLRLLEDMRDMVLIPEVPRTPDLSRSQRKTNS